MPKSALHTAISNHPRDFREFKYVYPVISRRSGGVSLGINLSRNKKCNFRCVYCQVDRRSKREKTRIFQEKIMKELKYLLKQFDSGGVCTLDVFNSVSPDNKKLKDVALSGDGEPTLYSGFEELCRKISRLPSSSQIPFKLVLITNGSRLGVKKVLRGIKTLIRGPGEVWVKLDAGSPDYFKCLNRSSISLNKLERNIISAGSLIPLKIQTLLCNYKGKKPSSREINAYMERLIRIREAGTMISGIQLYSLARPSFDLSCTRVSQAFLRKTAEKIHETVSIPVWLY